MGEVKWEIIGRVKERESRKAGVVDVVAVLLENRGIKTERERREFYKPRNPKELSLEEVGIDKNELGKLKARLKKAKDKGERVVIYGDYDADGICATAIMWEALYAMGVDALPYIPERFSEGYGINSESLRKLKVDYPDLGLVVTVDNGIVAEKAVDEARKIGIDVVITDHHEPGEKMPGALAIIHSKELCGAGVAWMVARELERECGLELCAIGTVADQMKLVGANRSFVKHGLVALNETQRAGLNVLYEGAGIRKGEIGIYEINYVIAPRLNAMGRLKQGLDSLRLVCTRDYERARAIFRNINDTNTERQRVVEEAFARVQGSLRRSEEKLIVVESDDFHEGVIGLIASSIVERYYRPAIVFSRGKDLSKASARSVAGFNIIETIRRFDEFIVEGGGHPMAAGFTVETKNLEIFSERIRALAMKEMTEDMLVKKLKIDMELPFTLLGWELLEEIEKFEPTGLGNPVPLFVSRGVEIKKMRTVGSEGKHLKLELAGMGRDYDAIAFGLGGLALSLTEGNKIDVTYSLERNVWNGSESLQLKVRDLRKKENGKEEKL